MSVLTQKRLLLLMPTTTYRADPFLEAAQTLGLEIVVGSDRCHMLADYWHIPLALSLKDVEQASRDIVSYARQHPIHAIVPVDDKTTVIAAKACQALGLSHNLPEAAEAACNKRILRELLLQHNVPSPSFSLYEAAEHAEVIAPQVNYPCVLKPLLLSGSRGVIRANHEAEFVRAFHRIQYILLHSPDLPPLDDPDTKRILVEDYIPGKEVALEGVLKNGHLHVLTIFDKPDPLDGPFFEETIYVTPSRLPESIQTSIIDATAVATKAIGLTEGPVHAELRIDQDTPWVIEVAGRSIGGLCARTLQHGLGMSLEELILRNAFGLDIKHFDAHNRASGVMMIPTPSAGILKSVQGIDEATQVAGIEDITITAKMDETLIPLPEGSSYPGFIFASGETPDQVENALRKAHGKLHFEIVEQLNMVKETTKQSAIEASP